MSFSGGRNGVSAAHGRSSLKALDTRGSSLQKPNHSNSPSSSSSSASSSFKAKSLQISGSRKSGPRDGGGGVPGRVRVAVRLRPRNAEEMEADADFAESVELQPELKRLKLRKNNWDTETYEFDEVFMEFASQKRVYEVVAKPVVESILEGYNGTIMAYGQTGTGKTYTLGRLGEEDPAARGITVRAMEDILAEVSLETDSVCVSYLQLYMETIQDLLDPSNDNISIVEDPKTGDVSLPGATLVEIREQNNFIELLRLGEAHRFAANTKLNTESSRSHAILMVQVKRSTNERRSPYITENGGNSFMSKSIKPPIIRKGKLVVVDLAGSERIDKSGSEGHALEEAKSINLSLSALGKCINALAENSAHVPVRDSKLTRLLRDSFGGTARTSLVITIDPSPRHRGETMSTIMFGQRAMKVENMLKLKEEFDYKSLSRRLELQLHKLIEDNERQQKAFEEAIERLQAEAENRISETERKFADAVEMERLKCQKDYMESIKKLEEELMVSRGKNGGAIMAVSPKESLSKREASSILSSEEVSNLKKSLERETLLKRSAEEEVNNLRKQLSQSRLLGSSATSEILKLRKLLEDESRQKEKVEGEITVLQSQLLQLSFDADEKRRRLDRGGSAYVPDVLDSASPLVRHSELNGLDDGEKASVAKLSEQVGLHKILSLLEADDADVRINAVKVVANLAAEDILSEGVVVLSDIPSSYYMILEVAEANQEKIVEAGGLTSLLNLLRKSDDETIHRVAAGAIANLAMNDINQELIMVQGGIRLLSTTAANAEDPQTLRMIAGAIANLCGNDKLQTKLRAGGGIKALLGMVRCGHPDVLAQVARGIANFAKCESRVSAQGRKSGRSLLIEDGTLPWIVNNANNEALAIRRHIELALCHLAQHDINARDMINCGALMELVRVSRDCSREDIRILARRTLSSSSAFRTELRRLRIDY